MNKIISESEAKLLYPIGTIVNNSGYRARVTGIYDAYMREIRGDGGEGCVDIHDLKKWVD